MKLFSQAEMEDVFQDYLDETGMSWPISFELREDIIAEVAGDYAFEETEVEDAFRIFETKKLINKENKMTKIASIVDSNKKSATIAATMEAGRIANNQVAKIAAKQLPMMVRGYADTPIGKLVIANLACQAVQHFKGDSAILLSLTEAMQVQAYQELLQTFDVEGWIDSLMDSPEIKKAIKKLDTEK